MGLIIKGSMKAFWNTKDWSQAHQLCFLEQFLLETGYYLPCPTDAPSMLDFPENERDSRKLKKLKELDQHFHGEQCRYYVPKQNITYKH